MKNQNLETLKKQIKNFKPSKTFIAISSALLGIGGTVLAQNIAKKDEDPKKYYLTSPKQDRIYHPPRHFEGDFFGHSLFQEIREMQREMDESFARHQARMNRIFQETSQNLEIKNSNSARINQKETDDQYFYELEFNGYKKEDIEISIKDKTLSISAKKEENNKNSQNQSNFYYSFYLPKYDQKTEPKITRSDNKITIILKKI